MHTHSHTLPFYTIVPVANLSSMLLPFGLEDVYLNLCVSNSGWYLPCENWAHLETLVVVRSCYTNVQFFSSTSFHVILSKPYMCVSSIAILYGCMDDLNFRFAHAVVYVMLFGFFFLFFSVSIRPSHDLCVA